MELQLKELKKMRILVDEWIDLGIKKSKLLMKTKQR